MTTLPQGVCRNWAANGFCPYGDRCNFAHHMPSGASPQSVSWSSQAPSFTPSTGPSAAAFHPASAAFVPKSQKLCRNVVIYGYCKFEGRGCEYCHNPALINNGSASSPAAAPSLTAEQQQKQQQQLQQFPPLEQPKPLYGNRKGGQEPKKNTPAQSNTAATTAGTERSITPNTQELSSMVMKSTADNVRETDDGAAEAAYIKKHMRSMESLGMDEVYRHELLLREQALHFMPPSDDVRVCSFPGPVHCYHSLCLLDDISTLFAKKSPSPAFAGKPQSDGAAPKKITSQLIMASNSNDGSVVVLRRFPGFAHIGDYGKLMAERWSAFQHPTVLPLLDSFISSEINSDASLFLVYPFKPRTVTLEQHCKALANGAMAHVPIPEQLLWSLACQLLGALNAMHKGDLSARSSISPSRVLISPATGRVFVGSCGMDDITFDKPHTVNPAEDFARLGMVLLCAALKSPYCYITDCFDKEGGLAANQAVKDNLTALEQKKYSQEFVEFVKYLILGKDSKQPTISEALVILGPHMLEECGRVYSWSDVLENQLQLEMHNGRLFRILSKLTFVVRQQQIQQSRQPQQAIARSRGDVKMNQDSILQYFYQYLFQNDGPVSDLANVVDCLNKLDVGSGEVIALPSSDQQQVYMVMFSDLKRILLERFASYSASVPSLSQSSLSPSPY